MQYTPSRDQFHLRNTLKNRGIDQQIDAQLKPLHEDKIIYEALMTPSDLFTKILLSVNFWLGFTVLVHGRPVIFLIARMPGLCHRRQMPLNQQTSGDSGQPTQPSTQNNFLRRTNSCPCSLRYHHPPHQSPVLVNYYRERTSSAKPLYTATLHLIDN